MLNITKKKKKKKKKKKPGCPYACSTYLFAFGLKVHFDSYFKRLKYVVR